MNRLLPIYLVLAALATPVRAQQTISARIFDNTTKLPIADAGVQLAGTSRGAVSDANGRFSLSVQDANAQLIISHLGYQTLQLSVPQPATDIQLVEQTYQIGEVVVKYVDLQKLLVRKWRVDDASVDAAAEHMLAVIKQKDPAKYEKLAKKPDAMREAVKLIRLVFNDDGTAKVKALLFLGQSFSWQLDDDSRAIVLVDKEGHERKQVIRELTETRLVLTSTSKNGTASDISYSVMK